MHLPGLSHHSHPKLSPVCTNFSSPSVHGAQLLSLDTHCPSDSSVFPWLSPILPLALGSAIISRVDTVRPPSLYIIL